MQIRSRFALAPVLVLVVGLVWAVGCSSQEAEKLAEEARDVTDSGIGTSPVGAGAAAEGTPIDEDEKKLKKSAEELARNVEDSAATMKDTYEKERASGKGAVESASDAYEAVEKKAQ